MNALVTHSLLLCAALLGGCSAAAHPLPPAARTTSVTTRPASAPPVPVIYMYEDDKGHQPLAITADQAQELTNAAKHVWPGANVWFILVLSSFQDPDYLVEAEVYYTPDTQTPRLRRGRYVHIYASPESRLHPAEADAVPRWHYVQVSPADKPFGQTLEPPEPGLYLPCDWFRDTAMNDQQLIAVIDAFHDDVDENGRNKHVLHERIVEVSVGDEVEVQYGYCDTCGEFMTFRPKPNGTYGRAGSGVFVR